MSKLELSKEEEQIILDHRRRIEEEYRDNKILTKTGVLKHDLYSFKINSVFEIDSTLNNCIMTQKEKQKIVSKLSKTIKILVKAGTIFEYWESPSGDSNWQNNKYWLFQDQAWGKKNLKNIKTIKKELK